jgi:hypothetical protein
LREAWGRLGSKRIGFVSQNYSAPENWLYFSKKPAMGRPSSPDRQLNTIYIFADQTRCGQEMEMQGVGAAGNILAPVV